MLLNSEPIDVGTDEKGVYERVIEMRFITKYSEGAITWQLRNQEFIRCMRMPFQLGAEDGKLNRYS